MAWWYAPFHPNSYSLEEDVIRRTLAAGLVSGVAVMGLATGTALAKHGPPPRADKFVCSPSGNGGTLVNGVCLLPAASVGQPYEGFIITSLEAGGGFKIIAGSLPPGLQMPTFYGAAGTIVGGTPTQAGTFTFTVTGVDQHGVTVPPQTYSITVGPALPFALGEAGDTTGTVGQSFLQNVFVSGGVGPYSFSVTSGQLPPGLTLNTSDGASITGTPRTAGKFTFTITGTDGNGDRANLQESITIN
jgi:large repetitive protein